MREGGSVVMIIVWSFEDAAEAAKMVSVKLGLECTADESSCASVVNIRDDEVVVADEGKLGAA